MKLTLWLGAAMLTAIGALSGTDMVKPSQPVLVELFTSEGCSSCPPADTLLEKLDREQPIAGAQVIVLSEHVDYWNHLGWADPYSSPIFSRRQEIYAERFGIGGPYTPEMVVNGAAEFVGSDAGRAERAIRNVVGAQQVAIRIAAAPGDAAVTLEAGPLPPNGPRTAGLYLVHAVDSGTSAVMRGENQGRRLHHVSIAKDLQAIGKISARSGFKTRIAAGPAGSRLIAFIQEPDNGRVWGAALFRTPPASK